MMRFHKIITMKNLIRIPVSFASLLILMLPLQSQAARIYVFFDPACMERLEYTYNKSGEGYVSYLVNIGQGEKLVLEVGKESKDLQNTLPLSYISCSNGQFSQNTATRINSDADEVYIIYEITTKQYLVSPVSLAAYYKRDNQQISYISPKYSFLFNTQYGTIGENISTNPKAQVYFEGRLENPCTGSYIFKQANKGNINTVADLVFVPEIGVTEERIGFNAADAQQNALILKSIRGRTPERYLMELCGKLPGQSSTSQYDYRQTAVPQDYDVTPKTPYTYLDEKKPATTTTTANTAQTKYHTVQKGETLYSLSKRYGVSVEQLRQWNNLGNSNTIRNGGQLQVSASTTSTTSIPSSASTALNPKGVESDVNTYYPVPYDQTGNTVKYHTVASGETVASIAMKYGYTEAKFREFNNLGKTDYIKIGQKLKTSDCDCPQPTTAKTITPYYPVNTTDSPASYDKSDVWTSKSVSSSLPAPRSSANKAASAGIQPYSGGVQYLDTPVPTITSQPNPYQTTTNKSTTSSYDNDFIPSAYDEVPATQRTNTQQVKGVSGFDNDMFSANSTSRYDYYPSSEPVNQVSEYSNAVTRENGRRVHTVQEGDNMYRIARQYGITVERLRQLNNLEVNETLIPYQRLWID